MMRSQVKSASALPKTRSATCSRWLRSISLPLPAEELSAGFSEMWSAMEVRPGFEKR